MDIRVTESTGNIFADLGLPPHALDYLVGLCAKVGIPIEVRLAA